MALHGRTAIHGGGFGRSVLVDFYHLLQADNELASANTLIEGVSATGQVCYDDGCSPTDEIDWWKVYAYKGDIVSISFLRSTKSKSGMYLG